MLVIFEFASIHSLELLRKVEVLLNETLFEAIVLNQLANSAQGCLQDAGVTGLVGILHQSQKHSRAKLVVVLNHESLQELDHYSFERNLLLGHPLLVL